MPMLADNIKSLSSIMTIAAIFVAALYYGQDMLVPIALAIILAFILAPIVRTLTLLRVPHGLAVTLALGTTVTLIGAGSMVFSNQMLSLAANLDSYKPNLVAKVRSFTSPPAGDSALRKAADAVENLQKDVLEQMGEKPAAAVPVQEQRVVVSEDGEGKLANLKALLGAVGGPLAKAAVAILFTFFLLLQHADIRDRIIRIAGTDNMSQATAAMSEAGTRLSTLFLSQAALNAAFGAVVAVALWLIGVPNPMLWGICAMLLRFVPFIGSWLAAVPPLLIAAGVDPGWTMFLATLALFAIGEPFMGQIAEPLVLGKSAGLSPFAMIFALTFWTLIWGPIGLILGVPITLAVVVLGRYITGLEFMSILLGDEPPLTAQQTLYHRLLSKDASSAIEQIDQATADQPITTISDTIVLPALNIASQDYQRDRLEADQLNDLRDTMQVVTAAFVVPDVLVETPVDAHTVLVVAARGPVDRLAADYVAALLNANTSCDCRSLGMSSGLTALADARAARSTATSGTEIVIISTGGGDSGQLRLVVNRAVAYFPESHVYVLGPESGGWAARPPGAATQPVAGTYTKISHLVDLLNFKKNAATRQHEQDPGAPHSPRASSETVPLKPLTCSQPA